MITTIAIVPVIWQYNHFFILIPIKAMQKYFFHLEPLALLALITCLEFQKISLTEETNLTALNVITEVRMLSQRTALLASRLVWNKNIDEPEKIRQELFQAVNLMEKLYNGLIHGDSSINLKGEISPILAAKYFHPPIHLDKHLRNYIYEIRELLWTNDTELKPDNPHLHYIITAASTDLFTSLDAVIYEYQKQHKADQLVHLLHQAEVYENAQYIANEAQFTADNARIKNKELEQTLYELQQTQVELLKTEKMASLGELIGDICQQIMHPINFICGNLINAHKHSHDLVDLIKLYQHHDMTLLPEIKSHAEEMDLNFVLKELPKMLSAMKKNAGYIRQLVVALQSFSRIDEGGELKTIDINDVIDSSLFILTNRLQAKPWRSEIEIVKDLSTLPMVESYPGNLHQVFINIISNAIDAIDQRINNPDNSLKIKLWERQENSALPTSNHPNITIRTKMFHPDYVTVRISDNGIGMTESTKNRLFEPFFTTKMMGKGKGLGLSISYQIIVEKHGGSIWFETTLGKGTEFWIEIPLRQNPNRSNYNHIHIKHDKHHLSDILSGNGGIGKAGEKMSSSEFRHQYLS